MTISVTQRIHIAPQGYEDQRIYQPAVELKADCLILLSHTNTNDRGEHCKKNILTKLDETDIDVKTRKTDIFDVSESLEQFLELIRKYQSENDVKVNVSSGSKITAISGMMACMFTKADPYYVVPDGYGGEEDEGDTVSYGVDEIRGLPAYPVTEPDYQLIQVLDFIQEQQPDEGTKGVLLKAIGEFLLENDLPAVEGSDKDPSEAEDIYPIIQQNITDPLERRGLITQSRLQGGAHIRTTDEGDEMLELGRSLINGGS